MQVHHSILLASCWAIGLLVDEASCSFVPFNDEIDDKKDEVQLHANEVASAAGAALAVVTVVADTTTVDNKTKKQTSYCPLNCRNGSLCTKKTIPEDNNNNNNNSVSDDDDDEWECVCPERFTGQFCEVPRRELSTTNCGDLICENGGQCAEGQNYAVFGAVCDCSSSITPIGEGPPYEYVRFVGITCEIQVKQEEYCDGYKHIFCVNNGDCRIDENDFAQTPCLCQPGFTGRHCEYDEEDVRSDCPLSCNNHGTCHHGIKGPRGYNNQGADNKLDFWGNQDLTGFMHCACDDGYAGKDCDYEYITCGTGRGQYCFHGSTCLTGTDICECENENGDKLAGDYCEFRASDHCNDPVVMTSTEALQMFDPAMKMTNDESPFCVNGGSCHRVDNTGIDQQQNDYYCLCVGDPRGGEMLWTGKRCEVVNLEEGTTLAPTPSFTESSPVVVPEPPTLTTGPTIPETPRPTASVPVVTCGDLDCRNGGTCIEDHNYNMHGAVCDCYPATKMVGADIQWFAGTTCEIQVEPDEFCVGEEEFCVNNGNCRVTESNFTKQPCNCPDNFTGRHCQYAKEDVQADCLLTCSGQGTCQHGAAKSQNMTWDPMQVLGIENGGTSMFQHCICDDGFAGTNCEYEAILCGKRERYCFHGSKCVKVGGSYKDGGEDICECTTDDGYKKLAGDYCEFLATDYCEEPIWIDRDTASRFEFKNRLDSAVESPFCVNDGLCYRVEGTLDYYCECEGQWIGRRCDYRMGTPFITPTIPPTMSPLPNTPMPVVLGSAESNDDDKLSDGGLFGVAIVVFVVIASFLVLTIYFHRRGKYVRDVVYQDGAGVEHVDVDSVFRDKDQAVIIEDRNNNNNNNSSLELTSTFSKSSDSEDTKEDNGNHNNNNTNNGRQEPQIIIPSVQELEEKDLANVEIV